MSRLARFFSLWHSSLFWLLAHIFFNNVFCRFTVFSNLFVLFLDTLGLDKGRIGVMLSLIPFAGLVSLAASPVVARFGVKRAFMLCFGARKIAIALMLLLPWIISRHGAGAAFWWVAGLLLAFALLRAIGETGAFALWQEVIPNNIRGQFGAVTLMIATTTTIVTTAISGWYLHDHPGTSQYLTLIGVGVLFGLFSVACLLFVRGGAPVQVESGAAHLAEMRGALLDPNFARLLLGVALVNLSVSLGQFMPLYYKEWVALSPRTIVWLDAVAGAGGLAASYAWGRAADRRGGKPVMLAGLGLGAMAPGALIFMPHAPSWGPLAAAGASLLAGTVMTGWYIGADRYLFAHAIPPEKRTGYIPVYYALMGLVGGTGPLAAGWLLRVLTAAPPAWLPSAYAPLLWLQCGGMLAGAFVLKGLHGEGRGH